VARPKTNWKPILVRFRPEILAKLDAWPGPATRVDKIHALLAMGLEAASQKEDNSPPET